jgi:chemotaxis methyl-accepting protein methylase
MFSRRFERFRHVTFVDTLRGVRAMNLRPRPTWATNLLQYDDCSEDQDRAETSAVQRRPTGALTSDEELFVRWLFRLAGLDARHYRPETLRRRLEACLRAIRAGSIGEARVALARHRELMAPAVASVLIGVTSFFRDPQVFHALAEEVLPQTGAGDHDLRARNASPGPLNVWSVGCSDGQELFSLAMILDEQRRLPGSYLLGTDCREDAVRHATAGIYPDDAMRSLPAARLTRHFVPLPRDHWQVRPELRAFCRWRCADALSTREPGRWDVILCRNMAMYLQPGSADALWASLESSLAPGGVLVLGKAERPTNTRGLVPVAPCTYRKLRG